MPALCAAACKRAAVSFVAHAAPTLRRDATARRHGCSTHARRARAVRGGARRSRMCAGGGSERVEAARLRPVGADGCSEAEIDGIARRVAGWLDAEFPEEALADPHAALGATAADMYASIRRSGEDEVGAVLLQLGTRLEGSPDAFADLFVGPWEVANKVAEFVIAGAAAFRTARPLVDVDDAFTRYTFMQRLLDGTLDKEEVNGAIAQVAGFRAHRFGWDGGGVTDTHFRQFGDVPPDVLCDAASTEWSATLKYMEAQLGLDEDSGKKAEALNTVVEAWHGFEMCRMQRADENDHAFRKFEVIAKWLHVHGPY